MKLWLVLFLVKLPGIDAHLPAYKTVQTEGECKQIIVDTYKVAAEDGLAIRGTCTEYDGKDEKAKALEVIADMLDGKRT